MAQMPDQDENGLADLILKIERCRWLAKYTADPLTKMELLELADEYKARMKAAPVR